MQIELIGCTSSGKSTLAEAIFRQAENQGLNLISGDDLLLKSVKAERLQNNKLRALLVHLLAFKTVILNYRKHYLFFRFCRLVLKQAGIPLKQRVKQLRRLLKQTGRYEYISRYQNENQLVLVDEGTVHIAHNIFVHESTDPNWDQIPQFAELVPMPEMVISLETPRDELIKRTLQRGHSRISKDNPESTIRFVDRTLATFDLLFQQDIIHEHLVQLQEQIIDSHVVEPNSQLHDFLQVLETVVQQSEKKAVFAESQVEVTV